MFKRHIDKKQGKSSKKVSGCIDLVNDHRVTIHLFDDSVSYRKGQRVILSIPSDRKTASGKILRVSEVVAHGKITDVSNNSVTINSKQTNPIISKAALYAVKGKKIDMFVEDAD